MKKFDKKMLILTAVLCLVAVLAFAQRGGRPAPSGASSRGSAGGGHLRCAWAAVQEAAPHLAPVLAAAPRSAPACKSVVLREYGAIPSLRLPLRASSNAPSNVRALCPSRRLPLRASSNVRAVCPAVQVPAHSAPAILQGAVHLQKAVLLQAIA